MIRRGGVLPLAWGAWLGTLCAVQAIFGPRWIEFTMLGTASGAALLAGTAIWGLDARRRRRADAHTSSTVQAQPEEPWVPTVEEEGETLAPDSSVASAALVIGLAVALVGASFGLWLWLIGGGIAVLGLGGLVRENLERRRIRRRIQGVGMR